MRFIQITKLFAAVIAVFAIASSAEAQLPPAPPATPLANYSEDFDDLTSSPEVLGDAGFAVFSDNGGLGAYFGATPGEGPQISALGVDEETGNQFINVYANYDNGGVHEDPTLNESISVFQSRTFTGDDAAAAGTYIFNFDFASNEDEPLSGTTTTGAFIRVFDGAFNLLDEATFDTTAATPTFAPGQIQVTLNPNFTDGGVIQFGFNNRVGRFEGSGIFYDNLSFVLEGSIAVVTGDFDGSGVVDCADLDGYVGNIGSAATGNLAALDLDGDGVLSADDANTHITTLVTTSNGQVGTFPGDLNCDGTVNVLGDAFALIGNLNNDVTTYSAGDLNFDGTVNVLGDAFTLIGNLNNTNAP